MTLFVEQQAVQPRTLRYWLHTCLQRHQTRRALLQLSDEQLADIGLSREQARHEGGKPFWRE